MGSGSRWSYSNFIHFEFQYQQSRRGAVNIGYFILFLFLILFKSMVIVTVVTELNVSLSIVEFISSLCELGCWGNCGAVGIIEFYQLINQLCYVRLDVAEKMDVPFSTLGLCMYIWLSTSTYSSKRQKSSSQLYMEDGFLDLKQIIH